MSHNVVLVYGCNYGWSVWQVDILMLTFYLNWS